MTPSCSGGTILSDLVNSQDDAIRKSSISGLVRGEVRAKVLSEKGTNAELFSDLDAIDEIEKIAGGYDSMRPPPASLSEGVVDHEIYMPSQWSLTQPLAIMPGRPKL